MIKYLVTSGCSFTHDPRSPSWAYLLNDRLKDTYPDLFFKNTAYPSQGNIIIQKKAMYALSNLLDQKVNTDEILCVVMWSGLERQTFYIDGDYATNKLIKFLEHDFEGGVEGQLLDLENRIPNSRKIVTKNNISFCINMSGGWYLRLPSMGCDAGDIDTYRLSDVFPSTHQVINTVENMVMLENFCKINNIKLVHQFFRQNVLDSILEYREHQSIKYLLKQLNHNMMLNEGQGEFCFNRNLVISKTNLHPSREGHAAYCNQILFPFLTDRGLLNE